MANEGRKNNFPYIIKKISPSTHLIRGALLKNKIRGTQRYERSHILGPAKGAERTAVARDTMLQRIEVLNTVHARGIT